MGLVDTLVNEGGSAGMRKCHFMYRDWEIIVELGAQIRAISPKWNIFTGTPCPVGKEHSLLMTADGYRERETWLGLGQ